MIKKLTSHIITLLLLSAISLQLNAQDAAPIGEQGYRFSVEQEANATPVKNQAYTGTCWSFSTASFLESELLRTGQDEIDLSEMYIVRHIYIQKALNYVRRQGKANFGQGSMAHDVFSIMGEKGLMPEGAYTGLTGEETKHNHSEMEAMLKGIVEAAVAQQSKTVSDKWLKAYEAVLDIYLGPVPEKFEYENKKYTPETFVSKKMKLEADDYIQVTSFTHHPFYKPFVLEVPDNFSNGMFYNVPIDELESIAEYAIAEGYTFAWDSDVSEKGFSARRGLAILPEGCLSFKSNDEWDKAFANPGEEMDVTQEMRQKAFDEFSTTDDHLMHISGIVKDQNGTKYYKVKNSWGEIGPYDGYLYASAAYFKYKTLAIIINKKALPKDISKKLGFN